MLWRLTKTALFTSWCRGQPRISLRASGRIEVTLPEGLLDLYRE